MAHFSEAFRLSGKDYRREWRISGAHIVALAAVLGPMMVLFGLKFGIVGSMMDELVQDPRTREIKPLGSGRYTLAWLDELQQRQDVAFVVPMTRTIAASLQAENKNAGRILNLELIPSGEGDPLMASADKVPTGLSQIVLSKQAAERLDVKPGDAISASVARHYQGQSERQHIDLKVIDIAPATAFNREGAFISIGLLQAIEDFRDGRAVAALQWTGSESAAERVYPGFRLYADSIYSVAPLGKFLGDQGIRVRTRADDIEVVQSLDRNLTLVFWLIAIIGLSGFSLSLGASLLANVDRKRKELSVLRLVGLSTGDIVWFPVLQAAYTSLVGWALATGIFYGVAYAINQMFADQMRVGQQVCRLLPEHLVVALLLTLGSGILAAMLGGLQAARIEPSEGLRDI